MTYISINGYWEPILEPFLDYYVGICVCGIGCDRGWDWGKLSGRAQAAV